MLQLASRCKQLRDQSPHGVTNRDPQRWHVGENTSCVLNIVLYARVLKCLMPVTMAVPPQVNSRSANSSVGHCLHQGKPDRSGFRTTMNEQNLWIFSKYGHSEPRKPWAFDAGA